MMRTPALSPLAGALALVIGFPASAAPEPAPTDLDKVSVYGHREGYAPVTSRTGTKTDTALRDVPQAISVVTDQLIRDQAMTSMADVVRYMPGIGMAQGEGHRDAPIFRGNVSTSDFFVDGIRDDVQYLRDVYNVERVEALKGPNSMIFGRGGSGGVINRVTKKADWHDHREVGVQFGDHNRSRGTADFGHAVNEQVAVRVTGLYEDSETFRDAAIERYGINPTVAVRLGPDTTAVLGFEYFRDERTTDRGVPSYRNRPLAVDTGRFFGNPELSPGHARAEAWSALVDHTFGNGATLRNSTRYARYDKFYQNVYPGAVASDGATVQLHAYNSATERENLFNQTDLTFAFRTGALAHTVLAGVELGQQDTDNVRLSGYFGPTGSTATSDRVPVANPRTALPVTFRASASDANNTGRARVAAAYLQDQIEFTPQWQAVLGVRVDRFDMEFRNNRTGALVESSDDLFSPRAGLVYKPVEPVSVYASYSRAFQPRAGEQLVSLTGGVSGNSNLEPERFENYELGVKWDIRPELAATAAVYRLERGNVAVQVPNTNLTQLLDAQVSRGVEVDLTGRVTDAWSVMGGYAYQEAEVTRAHAGMQAGTRLPQVPRHSVSLWNRYDFNPTWGVGLGVVHRGEAFATTSNTVVLPSFTRVDAAVFYRLGVHTRVQLNIENLLDETYYASAHNNDNIMPGAPRSAYLSVNFAF